MTDGRAQRIDPAQLAIATDQGEIAKLCCMTFDQAEEEKVNGRSCLTVLDHDPVLINGTPFGCVPVPAGVRGEELHVDDWIFDMFLTVQRWGLFLELLGQ